MMRIAYYSHICFSDIDLSYLSNLKAVKGIEVYYFIPICSGRSLKGAAINIDNQIKVNGIIKASQYPEIAKYTDIIDIEKTFVVNTYGGAIKRIKTYLQLVSVLKRLHIDALHITDFLEYYETPLFLFRRRTLLTVHDPIPHSDLQSQQTNYKRKIGFKLFDNFIIYNSRQEETFITHNNLRRKTVTVSRLGLYTYLKRYKAEKIIEFPYILYFGRITSYKGLDYLLPAMKEIHQVHPDLKLIVAGRGNFHFDISEYENSDYISFLNRFIPDDELVNLISGSTMVLCPYTDATQSGVVMSSFTFNKPTIVTNTGGLPEMVEYGNLSPVIEPKSIKEIVSSVLFLLDNPGKLEAYSQAIEDRYKTIYSWDTIVQEHIKAYNNILLSHYE